MSTYFQTLLVAITRRPRFDRHGSRKCHRFRYTRTVEANAEKTEQSACQDSAYSVGQHVRISKEKAKFAKSSEQNISTEAFRIIKVIHRTPRPVYELEDLNLKSDKRTILRRRTNSHTHHKTQAVSDR